MLALLLSVSTVTTVSAASYRMTWDGDGGYFDKIENVNGNTYGYRSWNQVSIEIRSVTLNGQTVSTMYAKSTVG